MVLLASLPAVRARGPPGGGSLMPSPPRPHIFAEVRPLLVPQGTLFPLPSSPSHEREEEDKTTDAGKVTPHLPPCPLVGFSSASEFRGTRQTGEETRPGVQQLWPGVGGGDGVGSTRPTNCSQFI